MNGLMLHCGGQVTAKQDVYAVPLPVPTPTYVPLAHESLITRIEKQLAVEGIEIKQEHLALAAQGQRLFGLMQVKMPQFDNAEYGCVLGFRNSYDKSCSAGLVVGAQVFVCDNLSFSGDMKFERKHTAGLLKDLSWIITETVTALPEKFAAQSRQFDAYQRFELNDAQAHDLAIRMWDDKIVSITEVPHLLKEWRTPRHPEFAKAKNAWRLFNAATETIKGDLWRLPARTRKIHDVLDQACGLKPTAPVIPNQEQALCA